MNIPGLKAELHALAKNNDWAKYDFPNVDTINKENDPEVLRCIIDTYKNITIPSQQPSENQPTTPSLPTQPDINTFNETTFVNTALAYLNKKDIHLKAIQILRIDVINVTLKEFTCNIIGQKVNEPTTYAIFKNVHVQIDTALFSYRYIFITNSLIPSNWKISKCPIPLNILEKAIIPVNQNQEIFEKCRVGSSNTIYITINLQSETVISWPSNKLGTIFYKKIQSIFPNKYEVFNAQNSDNTLGKMILETVVPLPQSGGDSSTQKLFLTLSKFFMSQKENSITNILDNLNSLIMHKQYQYSS
jgi:hypothetical protein